MYKKTIHALRAKTGNARIFKHTLIVLGAALLLAAVSYLLLRELTPGRLPNFGERKIVSNDLPLKEKWAFKNTGFVRSLASQNQYLHIWSGVTLSTLNANAGNKVWDSPATNQLGLLTAAGENAVAFYPSARSDKTLTVVDAESGAFRWNLAVDLPWSLEIGDGKLYVGESVVSAYDLSNGSLVWQMEERLPSHTTINVHYQFRELFVVAEREVYVLDPMSGHIKRSFRTISSTKQSIVNGVMYGVIRSQSISATDVRSGQLLWVKYLHPYGFEPVIINGVVYMITDRLELLALNGRNGNIIWKSDTVLRAFSDIVEYEGLGYVVSDTGRLYGFDLESGEAIGVVDTGVALPPLFGFDFEPSLIVVDNVLIVSFIDSPVYGFEPL